MLDRGVIEPSCSPWSSPVVLVTKRDNSIRFCVDYRVLNELTVKDAYPIPRVDDCLDALSGSKWYSTMDLSSGFWQVGLAEEDREKSAFATSLGLFQWTVMPFGLVNSPSTFERLMEDVLRGLQWIELLIYMDDIISPSQTIEQGLGRLRTVFDRLLQANLKLKPSKCLFFQKQTTFLGHVVSETGIATDPAKIEAVKDWPVPRTPKQMKSFLGLCSYYRRFVEGFASIARPLHKICEKSAQFIWSDECQKAFDTLKTALTSSPVLAYPDPGKEYILDTDASQKSVGAVLSQVSNGHERVIAYMSKSMNIHEQSYCTTRKELLAVVCGLRKFHSYLYGQSIRLRTDNAAVSWLRSLKQPTGQVARWIQEVETYTLTVEHRAGLKHVNADALSRLPCRVCERQEKLNTEFDSDSDCEEIPLLLRPIVNSPTDIQDGVETVVRAINASTSSKVTHSFLDGWSPTELRQSQLQDPNISPLMTALETGNDRPRWDIVSPGMSFLKTLWRQWDRLVLIDAMLHLTMVDTDLDKDKYLLVVPNSRRADVMHYFHDIPSAGHLGSDKTLFRVKQSFYWPGMKSDIIAYCNSCDNCAARKTVPVPSRAPLCQFLVGEPMERLSMDILGPLPTSTKGNKYVLVLVDGFTKWTEAYALPNQEAKTIVEVIVNEFVCRFGTPLQILSDQGSNFMADIFNQVCNFLQIDKIRTSSMRPQANGSVERFNRTLQAMLTMYCENDQKNWDKYLPQVLMAYRASKHSSTGKTPNKMMFGREVVLPMEAVIGRPDDQSTELVDPDAYVETLRLTMQTAHEVARKSLKTNSNYQKRHYDLKARKQSLEPGQPVWLYNPSRRVGVCSKLTSKWKGPYVIVRKLDDVTYLCKSSPKQKAKVYHLDRLIPYKGRKCPTWFTKEKVKGL